MDNQKDKFGVTIHLMTNGIDSGPIIYSEQIKFSTGDTYSEINCKAIVRGTDLMLKAIDKVIQGNYTFCNQWCKGFLYNSYNYNHFYAYKYFNSINCKQLDKLEAPKSDVITVSNGLKIYNA